MTTTKKNPSLQEIFTSKGMTPTGSSISLAGAKQKMAPTTGPIGSNPTNKPGTINTTLTGQVTPQQTRADLWAVQRDISGHKDKDRAQRSSEFSANYSLAQREFALKSSTTRKELSLKEEQMKKDHKARAAERVQDFHIAKVNAANQSRDARTRQNESKNNFELGKMQASNQRLATQSQERLGFGEIGVNKQRVENEFKTAQLSDATRKEENVTAKEVGGFTAFANTLNALGSLKGNAGWYLNA